MPEVLTHFIFCRNCFKQLKPEIQKTIHLEDRFLFLYAQTPNIPYYYSLKNPEALRLKQLLHTQDTQSFIFELVTAIKKNQDRSKDLMTFLFGYITHYALDIALHPYIYYHTGYYNVDDKNTHHYKGNHKRFEKGIDILLAEKYLNIKPDKFCIAHFLEDIKSYPEAIITLLTTTIRKIHFTPKADKIMAISLKNFIYFHKKYSYDPHGFKKTFFIISDFFAKRNRKHFSYHHAFDINIDYCNNSRKVWYHPITNAPSNTSLEDILYQAKKDAIKLIEYLYDYLYLNKTKGFEKFFENINLETGSLEDTSKMTYFKDVFH